MTSQQYCLRWNNYQNNLTNVFDQLLQSEAFVDVTLACEGQSLKCHKMVLSACSPFFQNLFFENPCSHPIVILKDIRWTELKAVVEFMYKGEINVSQEQLAPLLKVAEVLKIRGLADVSRNSSSSSSNGNSDRSHSTPQLHHQTESDTEGSSRNHTPNGSGIALSSLAMHLKGSSSSLRRKRRKISTPERSPSPVDTGDDQSNQHELDSNLGDYDHSPVLSSASGGATCEPSSAALIGASSSSSTGGGSSSLNPNGPGSSSVSIPPGAAAAAAAAAAASLSSMGPTALLNLHNAAAAAAAASSSSSSVSNELDLKPGIVEMIREEERAKMLESSHGWLGPSTSSLSESYQYQMQSLWQKCWNTNQTGMVHALRFRERGPLKSWRPETMAEAIFAVLREGLSLSQAARKYDIPYPTFVLYANRVHNMLGPSADGCSGTDLMADMRPKGRGRPQRILLGSWPEDHIRGVIRAVVFRDTGGSGGGKDDIPPFLYGRDSSICVPSSQAGTSHNGLDMSLHPPFGGSGLFMNPQHQQQHSSSGQSSSPSASSSSQHHMNATQQNSNSAPEPGEIVQLGTAAHHQQVNSTSPSTSPLIVSTGGSGGISSLGSLLNTPRHSSRTSSATSTPVPLKGRTQSTEEVTINNNPEIIQIKAEIPFDDLDDDEDGEEMMSMHSEEEEEMGSGAVSVIASAVAAATAAAAVVSPSSSSLGSACATNANLSSPLTVMSKDSSSNASPQREGNFLPEPEEVNTPSPQFQTS